MELEELIVAARGGDLKAYEEVVRATHAMVLGVCLRILRRESDAADAVQETFLRAFKRLEEVREPAAFAGWLRRVAVTTSQTMARRRRSSFLSLDDVPQVPVLDELEERWTEAQRTALAVALLALDADDRRICDRFYHAGWTIKRLADEAGTNEAAMRKRLQRIRDRLRKDTEMSERRDIQGKAQDMPARIVELLAKPTLVDLPENPVGAVTELLKSEFPGFSQQELPEIVNLAEARRELGQDPVYVPGETLHRVDGNRILRFDLTLPMLLLTRGRGGNVSVMSAGKVYRNDGVSSSRLQVFHQMELLVMAEKGALDPWNFMGSIMRAVDAVLPGVSQRLSNSDYPICTKSWDLSIEKDGRMVEIAGAGVYRAEIVRFLGGNPDRQNACGMAFGLERVAALRYCVDDLRKLEEARV